MTVLPSMADPAGPQRRPLGQSQRRQSHNPERTAIVWAASLFHPVEWRFLSGFRFHAAWKTPELDLTYLYGQWKTAFSTAALAHGEDIAEALDARI